MNEYYIKFEMKGKFSIQTDVWQYNRVSEVSDCCLAPTQQFSAISWREQVNLQWNDDDVCFVRDQHA
jgi:hypothetical protein